MSDMPAERHRGTGVVLRALVWATLLGLSSAGSRPLHDWERSRHRRTHDQGPQRAQAHSLSGLGGQRVQYPSARNLGQQVQYPSVGDQGQQVRYPSVNDGGQGVKDPCVTDPDAGAQTQKCAPGYYRERSNRPFLGRCVPCNCNGLANECEERTGRCLNCQYDSAGDRCERCKDGYYGNPAQRTCRVCPCPYDEPANSFATGCRQVAGEFHCVCRPGYAGERCERCAPGYYGDPLASGGSCRPCDCNGNGNSCDSRTGVCKNTLPKDTNTDEQCQECDSCAQTLLGDLERLDDELSNIKAQLENASVSASSYDRLAKLEKAIAETKALVNKFSSSVDSQKPKVDQLKQDTLTLKEDIDALKVKADDTAADAQKAVENVEKTHERAQDLDRDAKDLLKKIQALLDQLKDTSTSTVPGEDMSKMLAEAQRLVKEMKERNFKPQKDAAEKEKDEAQKLLDYIKANVSRQCDANQEAAKKIGGLLMDYQAKLKELEEALKVAEDMVKKANTQNGLNSAALIDLLKRIEDLKKERDTVKAQIAMAEDQLKNTEDLLKMLNDSKKEYEQLAAQLDGAKTDLTKRVNIISQAAAKEDIVEQAERHAEELSKLAKDLEDAVKNSSGSADVRDAMAAIDAYKKITDAINEAEKAANEAKDAADNALKDVNKEDLTKRAKDLKDSSNKLLREAEKAKKDLKEASGDLDAQKNRLKDAENKKKILEKDLLDAQTELNNIKRDDIADMLDEAKRKAAAANGTAGSTMDRLSTIREEIDKISVLPAGSNISGLLEDVDKSVKNLINTIPTLEDKLAEVENLTSQLSPVTSLTENIRRIKELIEQARDAANRVVVPMKFSGNGHVEMRPPRDLEDLKAYTAISLSLQRPTPATRGDGRRRRRQAAAEGNMFVLYLGNKDSSKDYIGMVLRNNVLFCVYKLNGVEYKIETGLITPSASEPAFFDKVDMNRIYQDAEVVFTKLFTSSEPDAPKISSNQGEQAQNLLDLEPSNVVFYVGGYPANFTPPASLNYPKYEGCLELSTFNNRFISLYNFKEAVNINLESPCKRYVPPEVFHYFDGTGYAKLAINNSNSILVFVQTALTRSENGLLLYIGNEDIYFTVSIERGYVFINSNVLPNSIKSDAKIFPLAKESDVQVILDSRVKQIKVRVGSPEDVASAPFLYTPEIFTKYYLGGLPNDLRDKHNITIPPLKECIKNVKVNGKFPTFEEKLGVSRGCPSNFLVARKAELALGSSLSAGPRGFSLAGDITVSLGFKTTENNGLLMQNSQTGTGMELTLVDGYVVLKFNNQVWKSNNQYQDGKRHYITVTRRTQSIELLIDEQDKAQPQSPSSFLPSPDSSVFLGKETFKGCLSNLYMRRPDNLYKAEDLSEFSSSGDVLIDICSADRPPQLMLDSNNSKRR